jgi:ABC-type dipeptide/oligopeptide/nickel transport system permease subunit
MSLRRKIWIRRIKNFWQEYSHNKIGLVGLAIILLYVAVAVLTPVLLTNNPETPNLAENYAMPEWMAIIDPSCQDLPRTTDYIVNWNWTPEALPENVTIQQIGDKWVVNYTDGTEPVLISLTGKYYYQYTPPKTFYYTFKWAADPEYISKDNISKATAEYALEINLTTPNNKTFPIFDQHWWQYKDTSYGMYKGKGYSWSSYFDMYGYDAYRKLRISPILGIYVPTWDSKQSSVPVYLTVARYLPVRLGYKPWRTEQMTYDLFYPKGEYTVKLYVIIQPTQAGTPGTCTVSITKFDIHVPGLLWGILGTQYTGADVWSRLVSGVRISLAVGLMAAFLSTSLGILVGVFAGYYGGLADEALMRVVDILLCLPVLPLLLVLVTFFGRSVYWIVFLIAVFGWQGLARVIRSQVLSIRELPFIESAVASGGSKSYIMMRHIVPNIMPIALADLVLTVPGAILLEAGLSFIGFGDPSAPTWGREFNLAFFVGEGFSKFAWWWIIPPGIAITTLCVAFVFVGHAVDEIVNPRLRRRR